MKYMKYIVLVISFIIMIGIVKNKREYFSDNILSEDESESNLKKAINNNTKQITDLKKQLISSEEILGELEKKQKKMEQMQKKANNMANKATRQK